MDQNLKARLIGAIVLVVLAVLLIPELLSGRKSPQPEVQEEPARPGTRTLTIELGTSAGTPVAAAPTQAPVVETAEPPTEVAAPPARVPVTEAPAAKPEAAPPATPQAAAPERNRAEPVAEPVAGPRSQAPAAGGDWWVQVGAFGSVDTARRLVRELEAAGHAAQASPITRSGRTLHRVRVGPAPDRAGAEQLAVRLKARGLPATVVTGE